MEPIKIFEYWYTNDSLNNKFFADAEGSFIGTQKQFDEYIKDEQENYGMEYWDLKVRPATEKEIEEAKKYYGNDCFS